MAQPNNLRIALYAAALTSASFTGGELRADDSPPTQQQLQELQNQNQTLQEQLRQQQALIESLASKVNSIQAATAQGAHEGEQAQAEMKETGAASKNSGTFS